MKSVMNPLRNTPLVFLTSMFLGVLYPSTALLLRNLVIPALAFVMTLSLSELEFKNLDFRKSFGDIFLNYVLLSGTIILLSSLLNDEDLRFGFIVMAAAPSAIAVVPFSKLLGGDVAESTISSGAIYLLSLILTPTILLYFTGRSVNVLEIIKALVILILIPLMLSRYFRVKDGTPWINLGFSLVIYTVIGLNIGTLYENMLILLGVVFIGVVRTFFLGTLILIIFRSKGFGVAITKALFSSYKNLGFTAGVSLLLFGERASIPAAICIFLEVLLFNYYFILKRKFV